jgi:hypothetical protein
MKDEIRSWEDVQEYIDTMQERYAKAMNPVNELRDRICRKMNAKDDSYPKSESK